MGIDYSDDKEAPLRKTSSVKHLCSITGEVGIPFSELKDRQTPSGKTLKVLEYDIEMVPSGASLEFNVYIEGRKMGESKVAVSF